MGGGGSLIKKMLTCRNKTKNKKQQNWKFQNYENPYPWGERVGGGGGYSTYNLNVCLNFVLSFLHTPKNGGGGGCNFMTIYFLIYKLYKNLSCKRKKKVPPSPNATYLYIIMTIKDKAVPFSKTSSIKR